MKCLFFLLTLIIPPDYPVVQAQQAPAPTSPCLTDPAFKDFDFWLGKWDVTSGPENQVAGQNTVEKYQGHCAITENWIGASGTKGTSINHYNPITQKWRQLWIASGPYTIDITGELIDGSMALEGTISYYGTGKTFPFKGTWTPNADGSVRQHFEQFDPNEKEWATWFDGQYTKQ